MTTLESKFTGDDGVKKGAEAQIMKKARAPVRSAASAGAVDPLNPLNGGGDGETDGPPTFYYEWFLRRFRKLLVISCSILQPFIQMKKEAFCGRHEAVVVIR